MSVKDISRENVKQRLQWLQYWINETTWSGMRDKKYQNDLRIILMLENGETKLYTLFQEDANASIIIDDKMYIKINVSKLPGL